jgi:hypothetical protein
MALTFALGQSVFNLPKIALPETSSLSSSYRMAQDKLVLRHKNAVPKEKCVVGKI